MPTVCTSGYVLTLLELPLPEVAANDGVAMPVHAIGEVLAGHADVGAFPALQFVLVHKIPFLHRSPWVVQQYQVRSAGRVKRVSESLQLTPPSAMKRLFLLLPLLLALPVEAQPSRERDQVLFAIKTVAEMQKVLERAAAAEDLPTVCRLLGKQLLIVESEMKRLEFYFKEQNWPERLEESKELYRELDCKNVP